MDLPETYLCALLDIEDRHMAAGATVSAPVRLSEAATLKKVLF